MKQIMIDSSAFYLLGYNSSPLMQDGKFHEIRVRVLRPGLDVRHRNGYWAVKNDSTAKAAKPDLNTPNPVEAALRATLPSGRGVIRTWIGTAAGENGSTRVTVVWEPVPPRPGEPVRRADRPVRVILTAGNSAGLRYFRGAVSDLREPTPVPPSGGGVAFEVPPGDVELRFSVEQEGNGVIDAYSQQLEVPDFSAMGTLLGTPEIYRARTQPELQRLRAQSHPMPTLSRDFSRVESIMVRFPVYGPSGTTATLTGRLMNRAGQTIADISVVPLDNIQSWSQAEVSLANLPAGEYGLALNVTAESGEADCIVAFRVTP
jgi:hypothetical protein